jgi:hypothetical protein
MKSPTIFSLLLISGKSSNSGEELILGSFISYPEQDHVEILEESDNSPEWQRTLLFQITPIHDIFKSRTGNPAWTLKGNEAWFGNEDNGVAMGLMEGLRQVKVSHKTGDSGVYEATEWRGDWDLEIEVNCIEVWGDYTIL